MLVRYDGAIEIIVIARDKTSGPICASYSND